MCYWERLSADIDVFMVCVREISLQHRCLMQQQKVTLEVVLNYIYVCKWQFESTLYVRYKGAVNMKSCHNSVASVAVIMSTY